LENISITYTAGYGTDGVDVLPKSIKMDMLRAISHYYNNRFDVNAERFTYRLANKYTRNAGLV
ncbi:MAG: hypothetical protein ACRC2J_16265, partial [Microcoleaceae cyanobacterium]